MSAAVERDTLQKGIYSRAINEVPFTAGVTGASAMREPSEAGARLLGRNRLPGTRVGGSNERIRRRHSGSCFGGRKLDVSAPYVEGKKKKKSPTNLRPRTGPASAEISA